MGETFLYGSASSAENGLNFMQEKPFWFSCSRIQIVFRTGPTGLLQVHYL